MPKSHRIKQQQIIMFLRQVEVLTANGPAMDKQRFSIKHFLGKNSNFLWHNE
jgi:hypothetical protein